MLSETLTHRLFANGSRTRFLKNVIRVLPLLSTAVPGHPSTRMVEGGREDVRTAPGSGAGGHGRPHSRPDAAMWLSSHRGVDPYQVPRATKSILSANGT